MCSGLINWFRHFVFTCPLCFHQHDVALPLAVRLMTWATCLPFTWKRWQINVLVPNFNVSSMGSALQSSFIKHIKISVCTLYLSISLTKVSTQYQSLLGKPEHPKSKLSMFCAPSQKFFFFFFAKKYDYLEANCLKNSKKYIKILVGPEVLELLIKTCKILFWSIT